jgi:hypothetical protein
MVYTFVDTLSTCRDEARGAFFLNHPYLYYNYYYTDLGVFYGSIGNYGKNK